MCIKSYINMSIYIHVCPYLCVFIFRYSDAPNI